MQKLFGGEDRSAPRERSRKKIEAKASRPKQQQIGDVKPMTMAEIKAVLAEINAQEAALEAIDRARPVYATIAAELARLKAPKKRRTKKATPAPEATPEGAPASPPEEEPVSELAADWAALEADLQADRGTVQIVRHGERFWSHDRAEPPFARQAREDAERDDWGAFMKRRQERAHQAEQQERVEPIDAPTRHIPIDEMREALVRAIETRRQTERAERDEWEIVWPCSELSAPVVVEPLPAAKPATFSKFPKKRPRQSVARDARFYLSETPPSEPLVGGEHSVIKTTLPSPSIKEGKTGKHNSGATTFATWQNRYRDQPTPTKHWMPASAGCLSVYATAQQAFDYMALARSMYAFSLNLAPDIEYRAYFKRDRSRRPDTVPWMVARLKLSLEAASQSSEVVVIGEEAPVRGYDRDGIRKRSKREALGLPPNVRLHFHGFGIGAQEDERVIRAAYRKAGGKQKSGWMYQCKLQFAPTTGWVGYCCKDVFRSSDFMRGIGEKAGDQCATFLGPMIAMTRELSMAWQERYNELRAAYRRRRGAKSETVGALRPLDPAHVSKLADPNASCESEPLEAASEQCGEKVHFQPIVERAGWSSMRTSPARPYGASAPNNERRRRRMIGGRGLSVVVGVFARFLAVHGSAAASDIATAKYGRIITSNDGKPYYTLACRPLELIPIWTKAMADMVSGNEEPFKAIEANEHARTRAGLMPLCTLLDGGERVKIVDHLPANQVSCVVEGDADPRTCRYVLDHEINPE